ncbi:substrate-binding periplasmic protein [Allohahella sp. A8]|uniref:substrate-binding periplasmic protein n=1 Tax=Allohahella sp. A8 TaxID=3141461 RepID=UPI000C0946F0|nr:ABC transporter [Hahellaceae bacterium]
MKTIRMFAALALIGLASLVQAEDKVVKLTSLEWPPYTGPQLPEKGVSSAIVTAAFKAVGYKVEIAFYPWARAVALAKAGQEDFIGYFPEYHSEDIAQEFIFSAPIGSGPLGFVQNKQKPVEWNTLDDIKGLTVGTVRDYVNTADFDSRVSAGTQKVEEVTSDEQNIKKVAAGRLPLAVIDRNVLNYLLENDPTLVDARANLEFNDKLLEDKQLFVCFTKSSKGEQIARDFAEGMKQIDIDAIVAKHQR